MPADRFAFDAAFLTAGRMIFLSKVSGDDLTV